MSAIAVITIEGVLARGDDLRNAQPTKQAAQLFAGLRSQSNVAAFTRADPEIANWWLKREHFNDWAMVQAYPSTSAFTYEGWRLDQLRSFLAEGWEIFAFIDRSPDLVEEAVKLGVTGICVSYPHTQPGWKEVAAPRAWSDVAATVDTAPGR